MTTTPKVPKVLRAERLELVDSEGRLRARIGPRTVRNSNGVWRTFRMELFDTDGSVCASVSVSDDGTDASAFVGDEDGSQVKIRSYRPAYSLDRAEVELTGGVPITAGRKMLAVTRGCFPGGVDQGPDITYDTVEIGDRYSLDRACKAAQKKADACRAAALDARKEGDRLRGRRASSEARRLEKQIERHQAEFEAREAARAAELDARVEARLSDTAKASAAS
jgi:hypothetical protein